MLIPETIQSRLQQIQIDIDEQDQCGLIRYQNSCFKVTLFARSIGTSEADWKSKKLEKEQMRETAYKVAIMLLKKELLEQQLNVNIDQQGFTNLSTRTLTPHEDSDENKDTRENYKDLMAYLTGSQNQPINHQIEENSDDDIEIDVQEEEFPLAQEERLSSQTLEVNSPIQHLLGSAPVSNKEEGEEYRLELSSMPIWNCYQQQKKRELDASIQRQRPFSPILPFTKTKTFTPFLFKSFLQKNPAIPLPTVSPVSNTNLSLTSKPNASKSSKHSKISKPVIEPGNEDLIGYNLWKKLQKIKTHQ